MHLNRITCRSLIVLLALSVTGCQSAAMSSDLLGGLGRCREAQSRELERRLGEMYAVGGPEMGLQAYLQAQHMRTRRVHVEVGNAVIYGEARAYAAVFHDCNTAYLIHWRADAAGKLTELSASAQDSGCL